MWAVVRGAGSEKGKNQPEMLRRTLEDIFFKTETKILLIRKKPFLQRTNESHQSRCADKSFFFPKSFQELKEVPQNPRGSQSTEENHVIFILSC